jgi:hypothetical protein
VTTTDLPFATFIDGGAEFWCSDLVSCLQSTLATVLRHAGHDPLEVLGAHWEFRYKPGDVRPEEFYYPCSVPGDLAASLSPHFPVSSRWHRPADPAEPLADLAATLASGQLVIAAVDNFYLPFRPAFGDVHAAHLVLIYGTDLAGGRVFVSDAMPPPFAGPIASDDFLRAWSSSNPRDAQDVFFSDARIDRRFMTLTMGEPFPRLDSQLLRQVLASNLAGFARRDGTAAKTRNGAIEGTADGAGDWVGIVGLDRFLDMLLHACARADSATLAGTYPFGWGMQAQASLHAELLRSWSATADIPELREAARVVEAVAHAWTGLRITAAHGRENPPACTRELARHAAALRRGYEVALTGLREAVDLL